jgi:hypothetical protein
LLHLHVIIKPGFCICIYTFLWRKFLNAQNYFNSRNKKEYLDHGINPNLKQNFFQVMSNNIKFSIYFTLQIQSFWNNENVPYSENSDWWSSIPYTCIVTYSLVEKREKCREQEGKEKNNSWICINQQSVNWFRTYLNSFIKCTYSLA